MDTAQQFSASKHDPRPVRSRLSLGAVLLLANLSAWTEVLLSIVPFRS